ncbi:FAD binding domain-containing protein [Acidaminobacter sp. JC074]|uniref:FAD binding domain-containing protein n=1 Tax=Acidaminobacter sp. JC074 TaxID=2530199 RepID=UPI001F110BAE|nr:FAD binding domain-containing protein [Acidaminobacter sp. JC074]
MIKRFKPADFEECLMGLPIENWLLVDEEGYNNEMLGDLLRPKMLISHLEELKGISYDGHYKIRAFTNLEDIYSSNLPECFKKILKHSVDQATYHSQTLGCHVINLQYDDYLMPYLVAVDASFLVKGYMKERLLEMKSYHLSPDKVNFRYNEIPYELRLKHGDFTHMDYDRVTCEIEGGRLEFSYFVGAVVENGYYKDYKIAIQLPSTRIIRSLDLEDIMIGHPVDLDEYLKNELRKVFHNYNSSHRLANIGAKDMENIFEEVLWEIVYKFSERSYHDKS